MNIRILSGTPLFQGIKEQEIEAMLQCLSAEEKEFEKDAYIYRTGDITGRLGIVMEGSVNIIKDDVWGNRTVTVPFNRQQMADYLSVDRRALSGELSRMQKEGVIAYEKNRFQIL